jgi:ParB family chromosome partitioning protein
MEATMLTTKPLSFFKLDPTQPRKQFIESELLSLGASMQSLGQLQPVGARPQGVILWGARRFEAATLVGMKELSVIITDRPLSETEVRLIQLTENMLREDLKPIEVVDGVRELVRLNPTWQGKEIALKLHLDPSEITRILAIIGCPIANAALADGRLKGISEAYAIAKAEPDLKKGLLEMRLSGGMTRDQLASASRKARTSVPETTVKVSRVPISLPGGISVVVAGQGMTIDTVIDSLNESLKSARTARAEGLSSKSFAAAMRDKSKKKSS